MRDSSPPILRRIGLVKYTVIVLVCSVALGAPGCQGERAEDLYELATFEEQQNNREHANNSTRRFSKTTRAPSTP